MKRIWNLLLFIFASLAIYAQGEVVQPKVLYDIQEIDARKKIRIPDIMGYKALKCDFHIHTTFSDGFVIPRERVEEAWREGLDAIALTDHVPTSKEKDNNENFKLGKRHADRLGILLIKGVEYSMEPPVGHLNFLFIDDANKYYEPSLNS